MPFRKEQIMTDQKRLARSWVTWVGIRGAALEMHVSEDTIREWLKEAETGTNEDSEKCAVPEAETACLKNSVNRYTAEQKAAALAKVAELGITKAAKATGISIGSLNKWKKEAALSE